MYVCERLWGKERELGFEGEIWFFQENEDDPFRIVAALCDTNRSQLAGGAHIGLIGPQEDQWANADAAVAHIVGKTKNMREKIVLNGLHIRCDVDGMKVAIICTRPLERDERKRAFEFLGKVSIIMSDGIGKMCLIGGDVRTSSEDLLHAWHVAPEHIVGRPREEGGIGDTGMPTALGAADTIYFVCTIYGDHTWSKKTVSICGLGKVGGGLARILMKDGYQLILSDSNPALYADLGSDLLAICPVKADRFSTFYFISHRKVHREAATVFAPCAVRPIIRLDTIDEFSRSLKAIVSAQNDEIDLGCPFELAQMLHDRGIVYVPGPAVNSLGIQMLLREHDLERIPYEEILIEERALHLDVLRSLLLQAKNEDRPPYAIAMERIARGLNQ
jgi:glutamate dehydrogenase/leucine dehydrogenase